MDQDQRQETTELTAGRDDDGRRIDRIIRRALPTLGLSQLHRAMRVGAIRLNDKRCAASDRVHEGDRIMVRLQVPEPGAEPDAGPARGTGPESADPLIEGRIILENEHVLALHKRRGTLVHGEQSLELSVLGYLQGRLPESLSFRPGPLHRLDRNSSGLILFGKSIHGARRFSDLLQNRAVHKSYVAVLSGSLRGSARWDQAISRNETTQRSHAGLHGDEAETLVRSLAHGKTMDGEPLTLVLCDIHSGRTHQIRAHAAAAGMPLAGDSKYGGGKLLGGYILHALRIDLPEHDDILGFQSLIDPLEQTVAERIERFFGRDGVRALGTVAQGGPKGLHSQP